MARIGTLKSYAFVGFILSAIYGSTAHAVVPAPVAFKFSISPSARLLDAIDTPQFMMVMKDESWDSPMLRIHSRNKPAIMLTNDANSAAPITSFSLAINEGPYLFGTGDFPGDNFDNFIKNTIYTDPGVSITSSNVTNAGKTLNVNFDGLTAGMKVIFNIDLDTTDPNGFPFPDYRLVLCGAPSVPGNPPTMPATIAATFTNMTPPPNSVTLSMQLAADPNVPDFFEQFVRPAKGMEPLEIKEKVIPEPSTIALVFAGAAGALGIRRGRR